MAHSLLQALRSGRVLLMDGAMGTELQRLGLRPPQRSEDWNLDQPEAVRTVHQGYILAGAEVLLTNTFMAFAGGNKTRPHHISDTLQSAVSIADQCAGPGRFVLLDIGPITGRDDTEFADLAALSRGIKFALATGRVDGILLETCSSSRARFAVNRCRQAGLPVLLSFTFLHARNNIVTRDGHFPEWFAERAAGWGVDGLGVNCGREISVADCAEVIRRYRTVTDLPLFARPNAGTPTREGDDWVYPRSPLAMAAELPDLLAAGACMIGGCCGTTPAHILAFQTVVEQWNKRLA